jgi:hypothetical protein
MNKPTATTHHAALYPRDTDAVPLDAAAMNSCPRCRTNEHVRIREFILNGRVVSLALRCRCGFIGTHRVTEAQALLAWNRLTREIAGSDPHA